MGLRNWLRRKKGHLQQRSIERKIAVNYTRNLIANKFEILREDMKICLFEETYQLLISSPFSNHLNNYILSPVTSCPRVKEVIISFLINSINNRANPCFVIMLTSSQLPTHSIFSQLLFCTSPPSQTETMSNDSEKK